MKWIKCSERLPEIKKGVFVPRSKDVLIYHRGEYAIGYVAAGNCWYTEDGECELGYVTHWQTLPEPPND